MLFLVNVPFSVLAQVIVQDGVLIISSENSVVYANEALTNQGKLIHQGKMYLQSNFINNANYEASQGTLMMSGNDQLISVGAAKLGGIEIYNGGNKKIAGDLEILNHLALEKGMLLIPIESKLMLSNEAAITQSSSSSYIQGYLYHRGNGEKFFPVGSANQYAPLTLNEVEGEEPVIGISYEPTQDKPYWKQTTFSGTYLGSTATVTFMSDNSDYLFYKDDLEILAQTEIKGSSTALGGEKIRVKDNLFTLSGIEKTSLPWITVGFDSNKLLERVFVPNAFSPGAPSTEDQGIKVYGKYISLKNFDFGIQDEWGRWVYRTTSLVEAMEAGWTAANTSSTATKYRYVVSGRYLSGKTFQQSDVIMKF